MNLTPYRKTVLSAVGTVIAVAINVALGNDTTASLSTAIVGLITTIGVFSVSNGAAGKSDVIEPSPHETTDNVVALAVKPRPVAPKRPTSKAVSKKTASKAKKVTERRPTSKKGE